MLHVCIAGPSAFFDSRIVYYGPQDENHSVIGLVAELAGLCFRCFKAQYPKDKVNSPKGFVSKVR